MKSEKPLILQLIEDRLISFGTSYSYHTNDNIDMSTFVLYHGNGKLEEYELHKSNLDFSDEVESIPGITLS